MSARLFALCVALLLVVPAAAQEQEIFAVEVTGIGTETFTLTPAGLSELPRIEIDVTFRTSGGESSGRYGGVLLWDVLVARAAFAGFEHNAELRKTFVVRAGDDYEIAFSIGEIHPDYGDTPLMLADQVDGRPIEGGYRVVVPGDARGGRNVREVTGIELR